MIGVYLAMSVDCSVADGALWKLLVFSYVQ